MARVAKERAVGKVIAFPRPDPCRKDTVGCHAGHSVPSMYPLRVICRRQCCDGFCEVGALLTTVQVWYPNGESCAMGWQTRSTPFK